jgi:hypothetical protein
MKSLFLEYLKARKDLSILFVLGLPLQANAPIQFPADFFTAVGIGSLLAGLAAVIGLIVTLRRDKEARILSFLSDTDKSISRQLELEKDLKGLEQCIVYVYNYLDILEGIAFLTKMKKVPKYVASYYKSFFEYGITMMAWYTSIPEKVGSTVPYDKRDLTDNWPSLVWWLTTQYQKKAYGIEHLPPEMVKELARCNVNRLTMFDKVKTAIEPFEVL